MKANKQIKPQVRIKSTGQTFFVSYTRVELGSTIYFLVDGDGNKVWNGNMSGFDETQVEVMQKQTEQ